MTSEGDRKSASPPSPEDVFTALSNLYTGEVGKANYFEEPVTHLEHALQAAHLAQTFLASNSDSSASKASLLESVRLPSSLATVLSESEAASGNAAIPKEDLIISALLHDIGHICAPADAPHMNTDGGPDVGVVNHEKIGADYLRSLGFSEQVRSHSLLTVFADSQSLLGAGCGAG